MKAVLTLAALVTAFGAGASLASTELAIKNACSACHLPDKKLVGPSYKDIAAKRRGDPAAQAKALESIRKGSTGTWGKDVMPPNVMVKDGDALSLAKWTLAHK